MMTLKATGYGTFALLVFMMSLFLNKQESKVGYNYNASLVQDSTAIVVVKRNVPIKEYFQFMDSIVNHYNAINSHEISEHILVRHNPWIIDSLANTDYYRMKAKDSFIYDQKKLIVIKENDILIIPDSIESLNLLALFDKTLIDINIPEFKLRIYEDSVLRYEFPVRVGRNESKYLEMAGRIMSLKTRSGDGTIVKHERNPDYYNPVNGHQYHVTKRDDDKTTKLPQIPFIETEINGIRNGQLIHPTTNPVTLGRAYSNGCIGTSEADAWVIYYYAPLSTMVKIRYDLDIITEDGNKVRLKDIYK